MTSTEFENQFGLSPEICKVLMEKLAEIVDEEVKEAIAHADYYMNPTGYVDEDDLKERYGEDCLMKSNEDDDGYTELYDFKRQNTAAYTFQRFISSRTYYGGYTSAMKACELMGIGWRDGV